MRKLKTIQEFIKESISRTFSEFIEDLEEEIKRRFSSITDEQLDEVIVYYQMKDWLHIMWEDGYSPKEALESLVEKEEGLEYGKETGSILKWYK